MANLQLKAVPEDLHDELRRRANAEGTTVRAYVLELIKRDLDRPSPRDWLARLDLLERAHPERPAAELVREGRAERLPDASGR